MTLIPSRRLALDRAHWNQLAHAAGARSGPTLNEARAFRERLLEKGYVLTLAWAHIEEVPALEDDDSTVVHGSTVKENLREVAREAMAQVELLIQTFVTLGHETDWNTVELGGGLS